MNTSSNASHTNFPSDLDVPLFTPKKETGIKILSNKQILQRLPIAFVQVKAGNNSEDLLHEIEQLVCSLYQWKEITKVYNNN